MSDPVHLHIKPWPRPRRSPFAGFLRLHRRHDATARAYDRAPMLIAVALVVATAISAAATPLVRDRAHRAGYLDLPGGRKIHEVAIPRLGGIAILIAFALALAVASLVGAVTGGDPLDATLLVPLAAGAAVLAAVGIVDDLRPLSARAKLAAQLVASLVAVALGLSIERIGIGGATLELGILAAPITIIWVVAVINAVNLVDGLDGLAASIVLVTLAAFGILAAFRGETTALLVIGATGGALIGFLPYNLNPASIIMGDTGAMCLGFVVAALAVRLTQAASVEAWVPIVVLGVPLSDLVWAVVRRVARGASVFTADDQHLHHQLLRRGLSQRAVVGALALASGALAALALGVALVASG